MGWGDVHSCAEGAVEEVPSLQAESARARWGRARAARRALTCEVQRADAPAAVDVEGDELRAAGQDGPQVDAVEVAAAKEVELPWGGQGGGVGVGWDDVMLTVCRTAGWTGC